MWTPRPNACPSSQIYGRYDWTATVTGTVTVVVFEYTGVLGGSYYISATKLSSGGCGGAALTCNSIVDGSLTSPLTFGFYTIQANGGDVYQFRAARPDTSRQLRALGRNLRFARQSRRRRAGRAARPAMPRPPLPSPFPRRARIP